MAEDRLWVSHENWTEQIFKKSWEISPELALSELSDPSDIVRRNAQLAALFNFQSPNVSYWFKTCLLSQIAMYVHLHNGLIFEKKFNLEKPHYFPQSP